ncbi:PPE family protein [Nocardia sp. NEAU-G5]|uniref:PPE family protein n=1 Tax=Nocardia albiluteola TaxID=2842303 RepID=A0ABS6BEZ3_9NOCA|nr:PPE domain-containing protein [Nocardia albiluteola]MBU3068081.1 PPE family protein [Nocardia albiluteola]
MVEPSHPGFTGTVWDAVPAGQLAHELTAGPGAAPVAETGLTYGAFGAGLGEAAAEYRAILSVVGDAWGSESSRDGLAQLAQLADWLDRLGVAARQNAETALHQATSYENAELAMPPVAEVAEAERIARTMVQGTPLGAPLAGLLDTAEQQLDELRAQAAQVMRTYEAASEKMAHPWEQQRAPLVSDGASLIAENSPGRAPQQQAPQGPPENAATVAQPTLQLQAPQVDLSATITPTVPVGVDSLLVTPVASPPPVLSQVTGIAQPTPMVQPLTAVPPPLPAPNAVKHDTVTAATTSDAVDEAPSAGAVDFTDLGEGIAIVAAPAVLGRGAAPDTRQLPVAAPPGA